LTNDLVFFVIIGYLAFSYLAYWKNLIYILISCHSERLKRSKEWRKYNIINFDRSEEIQNQ